MRQKIVVGNWKMYPTLPDAIVLTSSLKNTLRELKGVEIVLAPPTAWLIPVIEDWRHKISHVKFAAQNVWPEDQGAFTGEISAYMLRSLVDYAIVGHSERRHKVGESNELINEKVQACLRWRIKPILCVGETKRFLDQSGKVDSYQWGKVTEQLLDGLTGVKPEDLERVIIAYEPVWAIGTGTSADPSYALEAINRLKTKLREKYSQRSIEQLRFIYGGSVDSTNVAEFLKYPEIEGVLPGGASVKAKEFAQICQIAAQQK